MHTLSLRSLFVLVSAGVLFASGPASARGFGGGHAFSAPHAMTATHAVAQSFAEGRGVTLPSSATAQPVGGQGSGKGTGTGHHHGKPPSGGSTSSSSESSGSAGTLIQQTPATTTSTPVTADTTRNPALTGGTDPAIGQSSPPVPDVFASGGGTAAVDHSGGGANTLASCMGFWDSATHMSKSEWRDTCVRTLNGIDLPADGGESLLTSTHAHVRHMPTNSQAK